MADGERGRGGFRRRRFYSNRERDKHQDHGRGRDRYYYDRKEGSRVGKEEEKESKHLVILTKPRSGGADPAPEPSHQPTLLLRARDSTPRNPSPSPVSRPSEVATTNAGKTSYQIVTKSPAPPDLRKLLLNDNKMKRSVGLIEGSVARDQVLSFLTDHTDYLVVGCLGPPSVGKSYFLSTLVNYHTKSRKVFNVQDEKKAANNQGQNLDKIDVFVTEGRVIFLDSQAICPSILVKLSKTDSDDLRLYDNDAELQSYQYVALLLSVCHIVCCVMDKKTDENLIKFLLRVEVQKPVTTTHGIDSDQLVEYSPTLLLVHNKCEPEDYSWRNLKNLQESYRSDLQGSKMHIETGLGITNGQILPTLTPELCQTDPINIFLLPVLESKGELKNLDKYRGHLGYHKLVRKLRQQIFAYEPMSLTYNPLTEKNWYHYVVKIWENIKKNSSLADYSRGTQGWGLMKERSMYGKT